MITKVVNSKGSLLIKEEFKINEVCIDSDKIRGG